MFGREASTSESNYNFHDKLYMKRSKSMRNEIRVTQWSICTSYTCAKHKRYNSSKRNCHHKSDRSVFPNATRHVHGHARKWRELCGVPFGMCRTCEEMYRCSRERKVRDATSKGHVIIRKYREMNYRERRTYQACRRIERSQDRPGRNRHSDTDATRTRSHSSRIADP